ncbi:MAG: hypothetical protein JNM30_01140 [Rhodospirillales bacterium]|nr:hypothetical protein [Rhodospirillales bacterium]
MTWNFRGSLSRVDFQTASRIALPFRGCGWLTGPGSQGSASPVLDAELDLVARDDLRILAIQEEAAEAAERQGLPAPSVTGCLYRLGDTLHLLVGVEDANLALIKTTLLPALIEGRLHLTTAIDFAGFAEDAPGAMAPMGITRRAFDQSQGAVYFDACNLSISFNAWGMDAPQERRVGQLMVAGEESHPRL